MNVFFIVLIIGLFQAVLLIFALVRKQNPRNRALIILLSVIAFGLAIRLGLTPSTYVKWPRFIQLADIALLVFGPCFLLFFKSTGTIIHYDLWKKQWFHALPLLLFLLHYSIYILPLSTEEFLLAELRGDFSPYYSVLLGAGLLINVFYWFSALLSFKKQVARHLITKRLLTTLLLLNGITLLSWLIAYTSSLIPSIDMAFMNTSYQISFEVLALSTILISYQALTQSGFWNQPVQRQKYTNSNLSEEQLADWSKRLEVYVNSEKAYINPSLSLDDLSRALGINKVLLSQVVNQSFSKGFSDWINEFRITEFIQRVESKAYAHFTFIGIATECGFNNKVTFNKAFKKSKGQTPTAFFGNKKRLKRE